MFSSYVFETGLSGLGDVDSQAAIRGSIVDALVYVGDSNRVFFYDARLRQALVDRLNSSGFQVLNLDDSNLGTFGGGGTIRARVKILSDGYGSAKDAASVVRGAAAFVGYNATGYDGTLVAQGTGTGQAQPTGSAPGQVQSGQSYDSSTIPGIGGVSGANPVTNLVNSLTQSPVSLAVIAGAVLILVLVSKK